MAEKKVTLVMRSPVELRKKNHRKKKVNCFDPGEGKEATRTLRYTTGYRYITRHKDTQ